MERNKYNLYDFAKLENLTGPVRDMLRIEGQYLTTDGEGYDCEMEGQSNTQRFMIVDHGAHGTGWGQVQYLYVVDGHIVAVVWFGGEDVHHYSFTFNTNETLLLVPPSPTTNPCNQYIDDQFVVETITEYWIAEKQNGN